MPKDNTTEPVAPIPFSIEDGGDIPAKGVGRPNKPNPLTAYVKAANETRGKTKRATIAGSVAADVDKAVKEFGRNLTRAGNELNVTVRRQVTISGDNLSVVVEFWVIDKIEKPRTDTAEQAADATA